MCVVRAQGYEARVTLRHGRFLVGYVSKLSLAPAHLTLINVFALGDTMSYDLMRISGACLEKVDLCPAAADPRRGPGLARTGG